MWFRSLTLLLALAAVAPAQDPSANVSRHPKVARTLEPEFNALMLKYEAAIRDYDEVRIRAAQAMKNDPPPPHPANKHLAEFQRLAAKGSGGALGWILENLHFAVEESAERARIAKETFPKLLAGHADEDSALRAIEGLRELRSDLGEEAILDMAQELQARTSIGEVRGRAMLLQAWVVTDGDTTQDPKRWEAAHEIYRSTLYTLPDTRAGKEAAGVLIRPVEKEFFERERKWVDALLELQARGASVDEWPKQPMHDLLPEYEPIARAGHKTAQRWVNQLYPAYAQVERQGPGIAYTWLVHKFGEYFSDGPGGPWNALRMDLLTALYRQFPTERWVYDSLKKVMFTAEYLPLAHLEPAMQALLEKNSEPRIRAAALFSIAQGVKAGGDQRSYERAIELFTRIQDEFPDDPLGKQAEGAREELTSVMPGKPAPWARVSDAEGLEFDLADYKGRAVMLEFFSLYSQSCLDAIPLRAELFERYRDRPFSLLGVNFDTQKPAQYHSLAGKAGVRWRSALAYFNHPVMLVWGIRRYPTTILIDENGIIRARDLPWPEMVELTEQLVKAAEQSGAKSPEPPK